METIGAKQSLEVLDAQILVLNESYATQYEITDIERNRWRYVDQQWRSIFNSRSENCLPTAGDRIVLTATGSVNGGSKVYPDAVIQAVSDGKAYVCVEHMTPFVFEIVPGKQPGLDISGGYWGHLTIDSLQNPKLQFKAFKFWGNRPRTNGELYIDLPVYVWTAESTDFY